VAAVNAAWQDDWAKAIDEADKALGELAGGEEIRPYRALWHYILASWAVIAARSGDQERLEGIADAHFSDARAAAAGTCWLSGLAISASQLIASPTPEPADPLDAAAITQIASSALRTKPSAKFSAFLTAVTEGLAQNKAEPCEKASQGSAS
jgi:hypothetical protein